MRRIETLADVQIVLRQLLDAQSKQQNSGSNIHGLQVRNAADATEPGDYVTLRQLNDMLGNTTTAIHAIIKEATRPPTSISSNPAPLTPSGTTPPPPPTINPPSGIPIVTSLPAFPTSSYQVMYNGILYQFVGSSQFAGIPGFWEPVVSPAPALQDTHANRLLHYPAGSYAVGTTFYETDRLSVYIVQGGVWTWYSGAMNGPLAGLPTDLGAADVNFRYQATDYKHLYKWGGAAWAFDPNDAGSGFLVFNGPGFFIADGFYGLCDGSTYSVAQSNGSLLNVTPAVTANTYIRR